MSIQLPLPGDWPRNATWPDPLDKLRQLEKDKLDAKYEIRLVLDRCRETGRSWDTVHVRAVLDAQMAYLEAIGALGPPEDG